MSVASYRTSMNELGGGRIAVLLLLFALALFQFYTAGLGGFAMICVLPLLVIAVVVSFKSRMLVFWALIVVNYLVSMKTLPRPEGIPTSLYNEVLQVLLLTMAIIDVKEVKFKYAANTMLIALVIWNTFLILELLNDTCGLAPDFPHWYQGIRLYGFQLIYVLLVFCIFINTPDRLMKYLFLWGGLALFSVFWIWKQKYMGMTVMENAFLQGPSGKQHVLMNGALIRYFSIYSDAAAAGIGMASTAVAFLIFGLTSKIKKYKYIFLVIGLALAWGFFPTGTRTAIACFLAGFMAYAVLSKSVKITVFVSIMGILLFFILAFTQIGNGNQMIRRMRSAFDKSDASAGARDVNQEAMKKYLRDAPFGMGVGMVGGSLPSNHKYAALIALPPDSEYVKIWIQTGIVGLSIFLITTVVMFLGASRIVMFKLTSSSLRGIGAGLCCAFVAVQLGGYGNQVLIQYPNCLAFYGGLALVYVLPYIEKDWIAHEEKLLAAQAEKKRLKEEKKQASRVNKIRH